ncbi:MAG: TraR/DksA C4-type zinc finger protein [Nitrospirae bacterium]|nr:TraR/DksA C4-type zinc finger protein [Nitrospirota bacterium]
MPTKKADKKTVSKKGTQSSHITKKIAAAEAVKTVKKPAKKIPKAAKLALNAAPATPASVKKQPLKGSGASKYQKIRGILLQQKAALLSEAEVARNELPEQSIFPDMGDQASAETDTNFMLRLRGREQRLLIKIDEALERIDSSTFGICDDCGLEIDVKRLEARPVTTMCIECKMHQEEDEKRREV